MALPTSWAVTISTTLTSPSSTSTSTTARWAAKAVLHVGVALPGLGVRGLGGPVPPLDGTLDGAVGQAESTSGDDRPRRPDHRFVGQVQLRGIDARPGCRPPQQLVAHLGTGRPDGSAGHIGLAGRRRRPRAADLGVGRLHHDLFDARARCARSGPGW